MPLSNCRRSAQPGWTFEVYKAILHRPVSSILFPEQITLPAPVKRFFPSTATGRSSFITITLS